MKPAIDRVKRAKIQPSENTTNRQTVQKKSETNAGTKPITHHHQHRSNAGLQLHRKGKQTNQSG
jgi:hypothetical protein